MALKVIRRSANISSPPSYAPTQASLGSTTTTTPTTTVAQRALSTSSQSPTLVVLGGTGHIGRTVIAEGLARGCTVIATSRNGAPTGTPTGANLTWVATGDKGVTSPRYWREFATREIPESSQVLVVNAIGGAHPSPGKTLRDLNFYPAVAAFEGISDGMRPKGSDLRLVQFSSSAAGLLQDEYGRVKQEGDAAVLQIGANCGAKATTIYRIGYVMESATGCDRIFKIDNHHAYAPEQVAELPVQPVIGDGNQPLQPVAMSDVMDGLFATVNHDGHVILHAVGPETISQEEFLKKFTDLKGKPFRPIYIPIEAAKKMSRHIPKGHFAPYAVEYLEKGGHVLCHKPFEKRVGRPLLTVNEMYQVKPGQELVYSRPPVFEHVREAVAKVATCSAARQDLFSASMMLARDLLSKTM